MACVSLIFQLVAAVKALRVVAEAERGWIAMERKRTLRRILRGIGRKDCKEHRIHLRNPSRQRWKLRRENAERHLEWNGWRADTKGNFAL